MNPDQVLDLVAENGGATLNGDLSPFNPETGFQVALEGHEVALTGDLVSGFAAYLQDVEDVLTEGRFIGLWLDSQDGVLYADVSVHVEDMEEAISLGLSEGQKAVWSWSDFSEVRLTEVVSA